MSSHISMTHPRGFAAPRPEAPLYVLGCSVANRFLAVTYQTTLTRC